MQEILVRSLRTPSLHFTRNNIIKQNNKFLEQHCTDNNICISFAMLGKWWLYTRRNLFEILLNQREIKLQLPFSDWFGTKRTSVWFQINRKMVNTIWFQFDLIRFRKDFSVCTLNPDRMQMPVSRHDGGPWNSGLLKPLGPT